MGRKNAPEGFDAIEAGGCAPPIMASTKAIHDIDLVQLEARLAIQRPWMTYTTIKISDLDSLLARVKAAEADADRLDSAVARLEAFRAQTERERDAAKAAGIAEGLEKAISAIEKKVADSSRLTNAATCMAAIREIKPTTKGEST